ncbi:MAG: heavy-metal-associated domain-containing protein [Planctomycetes bacterium]|nr:heavy-metal-associated domain-containing protein [Planctomycetota bacterium]
MIAGVAALGGWLGYQAWDDARRDPGTAAPLVEFSVEGLDCPVWCAVKLSDAIDELDGARVEHFDRRTGTVTVRHDPDRQDVEALKSVFAARGFPVTDSRPDPPR